MPVLDHLETSSKTKADAQETTQQRLRRLLRENLSEQREIAEADIGGKQLVKTKTIYVPDKRTGEITRQQVSRRLRRWFWQNPDGTASLQLFYGNVPLRIQGSDTTIEVKSLSAVPNTIDLVIEAIEAGELDEALSEAMEARQRENQR